MLKFGEANSHEKEYLSLQTIYDEKGNVVEEKKLNQDGETEEINTFSYNDESKLMEHVMHMLMDDVKEVLKNTRDEKGRLIKEQKFYGSEPGEATSYVYNDKGSIIEINQTDEEGIPVSKELVEYNEKNDLVSRTKTDSSGNILEKTEIIYDENGNVVAKVEYSGSDNFLNKTEYTYNEKNNIISAVQRNETGKLNESITYVYDESGNVIEKDISDFHPRKILFRFDEKNHCIEEEIYDQNGQLSSKDIFEYDEYGNMISELNYNMDINRMNRDHNAGHRYEYEYNVD
jgi:hypothetical protein